MSIRYIFAPSELGVSEDHLPHVAAAYARAVRRALEARFPDRDVEVAPAACERTRLTLEPGVRLAAVVEVIADVHDNDDFWYDVLAGGER